MFRSLLFSVAAAGLAVSTPLVAYLSAPLDAVAQEATPDRELEKTIIESDQTAQCFAVYPFGQMTIEIAGPLGGTTVSPGDVIPITGTIVNKTHATTPAGRVFGRVLREDAGVADQHWHPIVAEFSIPDISVPATSETAPGEQSFTGEWQVPAFAPPGSYRLELSYLASDGSPIVGVPYVANMLGASTTFLVKDAGAAAAVAFDRAHVLFNGAPFVFRAVPPRPAPGPLTVVTPLLAGGARDIPVNVEKSLYAWTDLEGDTLISSVTEPLVVSPSKPMPVSFVWEAPQPGVYELVIKAQPLDAHILPSLIRVRFYYEGTVPRILHTGMRAEEDGSATAVACFFNSTFGPDGGSGVFQVESGSEAVAPVALPDIAGGRVATIHIPRAVVAAGFALVAEAQDVAGTVTDTERVVFPAEATASSPSFTAAAAAAPTSILYLAVAALVLVIGLLGALIYRRRSRAPSNP